MLDWLAKYDRRTLAPTYTLDGTTYRTPRHLTPDHWWFSEFEGHSGPGSNPLLDPVGPPIWRGDLPWNMRRERSNDPDSIARYMLAMWATAAYLRAADQGQALYDPFNDAPMKQVGGRWVIEERGDGRVKVLADIQPRPVKLPEAWKILKTNPRHSLFDDRLTERSPTPKPWDSMSRESHKSTLGFIPIYAGLVEVIDAPRTVETDANPFAAPSDLYGSAAFAWVDDLRGGDALKIGGQPVPPLGLFDGGRWRDGAPDLGVVGMGTEGHRLIVGPPGSGKFVSAIAPLLLTADRSSAVVFDVANGEAVRDTAAYRETLGPVAVLDPFGITGRKSAALNPLDLLQPGAPHLLETARRLSEALFIVGNGNATDDYFNDQARDVLTALLVHVATSPLERSRTLKRVREIIRRPMSADLLAAMSENPEAGGFVADVAANIEHDETATGGKNLFYVQQTLRANTTFLDFPTVQAVTATTTLDPAALRSAVSTLYVVLPGSELKTLSRWMRAIYAVVMETARQTGGAGAVPLQVVLDEFPAMGRFDRVADDMALVRKFGIQIHLAIQSLSQLSKIYGQGWESFTAAARFQQILGANDHFTAEYVSKRLGRTTAKTGSTTESQNNGGRSRGSSSSFAGVDLMTPDEVGRMDTAETLVLIEGQRPARLDKVYHYAHPVLSQRMQGRRAAFPPVAAVSAGRLASAPATDTATEKAALIAAAEYHAKAKAAALKADRDGVPVESVSQSALYMTRKSPPPVIVIPRSS